MNATPKADDTPYRLFFDALGKKWGIQQVPNPLFYTHLTLLLLLASGMVPLDAHTNCTGEGGREPTIGKI